MREHNSLQIHSGDKVSVRGGPLGRHCGSIVIEFCDDRTSDDGRSGGDTQGIHIWDLSIAQELFRQLGTALKVAESGSAGGTEVAT